MSLDAYATVRDLCRLLSSGCIAYAMVDGGDAREKLSGWASHMEKLAERLDDPMQQDAMRCTAAMIRECIVRVLRHQN